MFNRKLKEEISKLEDELFYANEIINDVVKWQEEFLNYLKSKANEDKQNKTIYEEIIKKFEMIMI